MHNLRILLNNNERKRQTPHQIQTINNMVTSSVSLNTYHVQQPQATLQRVHILFHFTAILTILYYRFSNLIFGNVPTFPWSLMTIAELIFSVIWFFTQAFRWRPVVRTVYTENLPKDPNQLPKLDVFICTADPTKEPILEVMNTVISVMGLDYPMDKLSVYLSDDGGAPSTLYAMKEACSFAKIWVPFCRRYGIKSVSPEWFFSPIGHHQVLTTSDDEFQKEEQKMKVAYEKFKEHVEKRTNGDSAVNNRPTQIEIVHDSYDQMTKGIEEQDKLPLLVYMSRERRPSRPHHYKAGALNALLRVSGILSNAPYILVLDCDMFCNEPSSAKQAMCFHLDAKLSNSLSFVQLPQVFYNVSQKDIYDGQARAAYKTKYQGMDGSRGSSCLGTCYYLKKKTLYASPNQQDEHLANPHKAFGVSSLFIASLEAADNDGSSQENRITSSILEEAKELASCSYEENTKWGREIGYSYESLLESTFTGYMLHTKGWRSVYLYPNRPCFLGCTSIDMKDTTIKMIKWASGLLQISFSRFNPLVYGLPRMGLLQSMCYAYFLHISSMSIAVVLYGIVSPFCLLIGVPLFPTVSDPWFRVFAMVYISSLLQHLYEVISTGGSIMTWWYEQRMFFITSSTALLLGCLDAATVVLGVGKPNFRLSNKAVDKKKLENYEKGKFDFADAKMLMIPLTCMVLLNVICFLVGVKRVISHGNLGGMFVQVFMSSLNLVFSYPILKGLVANK